MRPLRCSFKNEQGCHKVGWGVGVNRGSGADMNSLSNSNAGVVKGIRMLLLSLTS